MLNVTNYEQELCINLCYQDQLINNCSCASLIISTLNDTRYCEYDDEITCQTAFDSIFFESNPDVFSENVCRPACSSLNFDYSLSSSKFPTQDYITNHPSQKLFLRFILDYKDNTYTAVIENPATTFEILLGDVGGQMHLFIGISFLSFLEILELIIEITVAWYRKKFYENSDSKKSQSIQC